MRLWKSFWLWCAVVFVHLSSSSAFWNCNFTLSNSVASHQLEKRDIASFITGLKELNFAEIKDSSILDLLSLFKADFGILQVLKLGEKVLNGSLNFLNFKQFDDQLLSMFTTITSRLEQIQRSNQETQRDIWALAKAVPSWIRFELSLNTLDEYASPINGLFHRFSYYQEHRDEIEEETLKDFANSVISHSTNSIQSLMAHIYIMVAPHETRQKQAQTRRSRIKDAKRFRRTALKPSVFQLMKTVFENNDICDSTHHSSPQQLVIGLYISVALTLAKGFTMIRFSYDILIFHDKVSENPADNFDREMQLSSELYEHYSRGLLKSALTIMDTVSNGYRRCDPNKHIESQTFVMITELLQGYIENEVDLNTDGSCRKDCSFYQYAKVKGCYLPKTQYCGKHRRCKGEVYNCKYFDSHSRVCISSVPYRRYDWITYENGETLGTKNTCKNEMKVESWWRFPYRCSYCICLCDESTSRTSDRYISLRPVVSDIEQGMIVTGVKLTKKNRVIHIQIQQGEAMPEGQVKSDTIHWRKVEPISVDQRKFVEGVDYFTLKYRARSIDLDHLKAPTGYVVTGLKFRTLGSHVNLEMWVTPINFKTGKLVFSRSLWITNDKKHRRQLELIEPNDPRSYADSKVDTRSNMYVTLQPTSMTSDVAQLTVPFFDAQPVVTSPCTWLEGIQLYHKGRFGSGGFIGFEVFTYNFAQHLRVENRITSK